MLACHAQACHQCSYEASLRHLAAALLQPGMHFLLPCKLLLNFASAFTFAEQGLHHLRGRVEHHERTSLDWGPGPKTQAKAAAWFEKDHSDVSHFHEGKTASSLAPELAKREVGRSFGFLNLQSVFEDGLASGDGQRSRHSRTARLTRPLLPGPPSPNRDLTTQAPSVRHIAHRYRIIGMNQEGPIAQMEAISGEPSRAGTQLLFGRVEGPLSRSFPTRWWQWQVLSEGAFVMPFGDGEELTDRQKQRLVSQSATALLSYSKHVALMNFLNTFRFPPGPRRLNKRSSVPRTSETSEHDELVSAQQRSFTRTGETSGTLPTRPVVRPSWHEIRIIGRRDGKPVVQLQRVEQYKYFDTRAIPLVGFPIGHLDQSFPDSFWSWHTLTSMQDRARASSLGDRLLFTQNELLHIAQKLVGKVPLPLVHDAIGFARHLRLPNDPSSRHSRQASSHVHDPSTSRGPGGSRFVAARPVIPSDSRLERQPPSRAFDQASSQRSRATRYRYRIIGFTHGGALLGQLERIENNVKRRTLGGDASTLMFRFPDRWRQWQWLTARSPGQSVPVRPFHANGQALGFQTQQRLAWRLAREGLSTPELVTVANFLEEFRLPPKNEVSPRNRS